MHTRLIVRAALVAALATGLASQAQTDVYRWVDKDGKVHFSDGPPPQDARSVTQKRMGGGPETSQLPYATQVAMKRHPVALYVSKDCGALCDGGRALLSQRGIPFREHNAQASPAEAEALRKVAGNLEVPFLTIGEEKLRGFDAERWNAALDSAGYPRTRVPGQQPTQAEAAAAPAAPAGPDAAPPANGTAPTR